MNNTELKNNKAIVLNNLQIAENDSQGDAQKKLILLTSLTFTFGTQEKKTAFYELAVQIVDKPWSEIPDYIRSLLN